MNARRAGNRAQGNAVIAAQDQWERDPVSERILAGLEAARARGRKGGRPAATQKMSVANLGRGRELY